MQKFKAVRNAKRHAITAGNASAIKFIASPLGRANADAYGKFVYSSAGRCRARHASLICGDGKLARVAEPHRLLIRAGVLRQCAYYAGFKLPG